MEHTITNKHDATLSLQVINDVIYIKLVLKQLIGIYNALLINEDAKENCYDDEPSTIAWYDQLCRDDAQLIQQRDYLCGKVHHKLLGWS